MSAVKEGYKMTEVGLLPEDWDLNPIDTIFSFHSTSNYSKAEMSNEGAVGCIHYGLIHAIPNSRYDLKYGTKYYVSLEQAKYALVRDGDVIMVDASEDLEGLNKSVEVHGIGDNKFISGLHTYLLRDEKNLLVDNFRGLVLNSQVVKSQMLQLAVGMKVFGVSKTQLVKVKLPLPPTLEEQRAIATALSDVDALISGLDTLIEKKKAIKQGAMQELLTPPDRGGKRLAGFSGDWDWKPLGLIAKIVMGQSPSSSNYNSDGKGLPLIQGNADIHNRKTIIRNFTSQVTKTGKKGDIIMSVRAPVGEVAKAVFDCCLGRGVCSISYHNGYLYQYLLHIEPNWSRFSTGSTFDSINSTQLAAVLIPIPLDLDEQRAISDVLSDMDAEILSLETKRMKYADLKQGMMQELLTGKTRLI